MDLKINKEYIKGYTISKIRFNKLLHIYIYIYTTGLSESSLTTMTKPVV